MEIKTKIALMILALLLVIPFVNAGSLSVSRNMISTTDPNTTITVELSVNVDGSDVYAYYIDEVYPVGWTVSSVSDFCPGNICLFTPNHIKLIVLDGENKTISYQIKSPAATGFYDFTGQYGFNKPNNPNDPVDDTMGPYDIAADQIEVTIQPDFSIETDSSYIAIKRQESGSIELILDELNNFTENISLSVIQKPDNVNIELDPEIGVPPFNSDIDITVGNAEYLIGGHEIIIKGEGGNKTHETSLILFVQPDILEVDAGGPYSGRMNRDMDFDEAEVTGGVFPYTYLWDFGDNMGSSDQKSTQYRYDNEGNYLATLTVTDAWNNVVNDTADVQIEKSISGGGGGGGTTPSIIPVIETGPGEAKISANKLPANTLLTWNINKPESIKITKVDIRTKSTRYSPYIYMKEIELPENIEELENIVYKYFNITTNIPENEISYLKIEFVVPNTWVSLNAIDVQSVLFNKHKTNWNELNTSYISKDANYTRYKSYFSGFSLFGINGISLCQNKPAKSEWSECGISSDGIGVRIRTDYDCKGGIWEEIIETEDCCPECPESTNWSECKEGLQSKIEYRCENYKCIPREQTRECISIDMVEQKIKEAEEEINKAIVNNKDVSEALAKMNDAKKALSDSNLIQAMIYADESIEKAKTAGELPPIPWFLIVAIITIIIIVIVAYMMIRKTTQSEFGVELKRV